MRAGHRKHWCIERSVLSNFQRLLLFSPARRWAYKAPHLPRSPDAFELGSLRWRCVVDKVVAESAASLFAAVDLYIILAEELCDTADMGAFPLIPRLVKFSVEPLLQYWRRGDLCVL